MFLRLLTLILNQSFGKGIFPDILKISQDVIHKKEDTITVSNYHPISLLSVFNKILEKLCIIEFILFFVKLN